MKSIQEKIEVKSMKSIYISLPMTGHEDTYEQRLDASVEYVKETYPEYEYIITPKEISERLEDYQPMKPTYKEYLLANMKEISLCDAIFICRGWRDSKGCLVERAFAKAIGVKRLYQLH